MKYDTDISLMLRDIQTTNYFMFLFHTSILKNKSKFGHINISLEGQDEKQ